jgi:hypothetical protein
VCDFVDQALIAEFAQGIGARFVRRFAARDALADGVVEMVADFGVEFFLPLLAPELVEPVEFHAARSCFVNINNSFFLNIAYFGAEDGF